MGVRPTTTTCVAGDFRCFSLGLAERGALVIWSRRAMDRRLGLAEWALSMMGGGVVKDSVGDSS